MWTHEDLPKKLKIRRERLSFSGRSSRAREEKAVDWSTAMAGTQASLKAPFKDLSSFKGSMKRLWRERVEDAPIKKRVMAEMKLKRRGQDGPPRTPKVKRENPEERACEMEEGGGRREHLAAGCGAKALDLSPGLKRTLAQFTLSSQSSLGGPAAFSARGGGQDGASPAVLVPLPSPPVLGGGPLLVPCDSSTELTHSLLEGESISCFMVGGEKRLCLPQVLNSVLREFSLQQINAVCDELYVYCSRCDAEQLSILKVLGILPFNAPSCGLITLTDAQRLCNALLHPGAALPRDPSGKHPAHGPLKEGGEAGFQVEHQCLGKCQGLFVPRFYGRPDAPCIQCAECQLLFAPQKFVMHSHRSPDKRTCHWGFDSAKWPCYLQLGRKHLGSPEEAELKQLLDQMKEKFSYQPKRTPDKKAGSEDGQARTAAPDFCSFSSKLSESEPVRKAKSQPALAFNGLYPDIKQEPAHTAIVHPSYFLYTYDKVVAPNVSLRKEGEAGPEALGALLKRHCGEARRRTLSCDRDQNWDHNRDHDRDRAADSESRARSQEELGSQREARAVAMETGPGEDAHAAAKDASWEDDKDRMVLEIVQMYSRQQERLHSTLHKQMQLEMELEALRGGEAVRLRELSAERCELQSELEAVHTEHAQRLGEVRQEQRDLERRLEQLRQQSCACEPSSQHDQEARYAAQLSELRRRLDRAEADREELQEELCREREAREKLELMISRLKEQMSEAAAAVAAGKPSPAGPAPGTPPPASSPAEVSPAHE
ncbi:ski-like protein isoform X1 [Anguilla anguilla]|uniref:ski-like protein isoform X1 n=1 Tax=Anguilla anguilla TaxID=7936 RepID=UPI0015AA4008|nr:ski-like protein isoform X1 [Anguilla anguilla]XP_035279250.1 ski-like protein isoform X1 [Anguilla anguilla]XP_035279251.1 ski-like protein isoform X1 [Anguilla anguilla]